ncbi:MAG: lamin tail domain-containing protein, partial [Bacteroidota bacterium]
SFNIGGDLYRLGFRFFARMTNRAGTLIGTYVAAFLCLLLMFSFRGFDRISSALWFTVSTTQSTICQDGGAPINLPDLLPENTLIEDAQSCGVVVAADLFISEYIEGSSNNKCIEIYNGTQNEIALADSNYQLNFYFNGNSSSSTNISLTGTVLPGDVFVVCDNNADQVFLDQTDQISTSTFFNGDDAVALSKNGVVLDVVGQIGFDPGSRWGTISLGTQNRTLIRKDTVQTGDPDGSDVFDPQIEWFALAQDDVSDLGQHTRDSLDCRLINDPGSYVPYTDSIVKIEVSFIPDMGGLRDTIFIDFELFEQEVDTVEARICAGDSILFDGRQIKDAGVFFDTLNSTFGCDSLIAITVSVLDTTAQNIDTVICAGDSIDFGSLTINAAGDYVQTFTSAIGCDSTVNLSVETLNVRDTLVELLICPGDSIVFDGQIINAANTVRATLTSTETGCDSTVELRVTLHPAIELLDGILPVCSDRSEINISDLESLIGVDTLSYTITRNKKVFPEDLFISEYVEGSSNNKCIELYNGTEASINLEEGVYQILQFFNGNNTTTNVRSLIGVIPSGGTFVLCDDGVDSGLGVVADTLFAGSFYNGDDAIVLLKGADTLDILGVIGEDPGAGWTGGGLSTQNQTLRRKPEIIKGVMSNPLAFDPSQQWDGQPIDDVSGLGNHAVIITSLLDTLSGTVDLNIEDTLSITAQNSTTGCQSQSTLIVDILPSDMTIVPVSICADSLFIWNGNRITVSGVYADTFQNRFLCDSIVSADVEILDTFNIVINEIICLGDSIDIGGVTIKADTSYIQEFQSVSG